MKIQNDRNIEVMEMLPITQLVKAKATLADEFKSRWMNTYKYSKVQSTEKLRTKRKYTVWKLHFFNMNVSLVGYLFKLNTSYISYFTCWRRFQAEHLICWRSSQAVYVSNNENSFKLDILYFEDLFKLNQRIPQRACRHINGPEIKAWICLLPTI